jgi:hypothetical protein
MRTRYCSFYSIFSKTVGKDTPLSPWFKIRIIYYDDLLFIYYCNIAIQPFFYFSSTNVANGFTLFWFNMYLNKKAITKERPRRQQNECSRLGWIESVYGQKLPSTRQPPPQHSLLLWMSEINCYFVCVLMLNILAKFPLLLNVWL